VDVRSPVHEYQLFVMFLQVVQITLKAHLHYVLRSISLVFGREPKKAPYRFFSHLSWAAFAFFVRRLLRTT
ncbi:hypothetical protein BCS62_14030, partial [Vibrio cyclitrophicus]